MRPAVAAACAVALGALLLLTPQAALAGWRTAFVALGSVPVGAVALLLVARLTGAAWQAALLPLARGVPLLLPALVPLVVQQALFADPPAHLGGWLWWPAFGLRGLLAIGLWWWLARRAAAGTLDELTAGLGLVAHGIAVTLIGGDWILGLARGQPQSAIGFVLATMQILAACAAACLFRLGEERVRRDLSFLLLAACLGLGYLLFMDFLIVWYGNLPARIGWYLLRERLPWSPLPGLALVAGIALPILSIAFGRDERARLLAGAGAAIALLLIAAWQVAPIAGGLALAASLPAALLLALPLWRWR